MSVITAVAVVILTALIKGDDRKGLGKLAAFLRILSLGVPLWRFVVVLVTAVLGTIQWRSALDPQLSTLDSGLSKGHS